MDRRLPYLFVPLIALVLVAAPWAYSSAHSRSVRNFRTVREGVFYRSGQLGQPAPWRIPADKPGVETPKGFAQLWGMSGLDRVLHDYDLRTIITLRDAHESEAKAEGGSDGVRPPDWREEEFCRRQAIKYVRLSPKSWQLCGGVAEADANVRKLLEVMDDPANFPVLVHCFAGIHRTGACVAVWRMEYDRWSNRDAIAELRECGYDHLSDERDVLGYLEAYVPRWKR